MRCPVAFVKLTTGQATWGKPTRYNCMSGDVKLTDGVFPGDELVEQDTGYRYLFDSTLGQWVRQVPVPVDETTQLSVQLLRHIMTEIQRGNEFLAEILEELESERG